MAGARRVRVTLPAAEARHLVSLLFAAGCEEIHADVAGPRATVTVRFGPVEPGYVEDRVESWLQVFDVQNDATVETARDDGPWEPGWRAIYAGAVVGRFSIRPPWAPARPAGLDVVIDPRGAFGSGVHPATVVMLRALETALAGRTPGTLLDVGAGTGVLSVAAARLGWIVTALEIKASARAACRRTVEANTVAVSPLDARLEDLDGRFDAVLANLYADAIARLAPHLARVTAPGGALLLGGFHPPERGAIARRFGWGDGALTVSDDGEWAAVWLQAAVS